MKKISVIVPLYKGNKYVQGLIHMILTNAIILKDVNSSTEVELILVNDYPTEKIIFPEDIVIQKNISVKLLTHKENEGIHQARVTGLKNSDADYIVFLDQDDFIIDTCLMEEFSCIEKNEADVIVANATIELSENKSKQLFKGRGQYKNAFEIDPYIYSGNKISSPGLCMIRRKSIPVEWYSYIMHINGSDDYFLWILMLLKKCKFVMCNKNLYIHKYTGENLSDDEGKMIDSNSEFVEYLKRIEYVPNRYIRIIERSNGLKNKIAHSTCWNKFVIIIANLDIIIPRVYWKIRECIIR